MASEAHIVDNFKLAEGKAGGRLGTRGGSLADEPEVHCSTGEPVLVVHRVGTGAWVVLATVGPGKLALLGKPAVAHVDPE